MLISNAYYTAVFDEEISDLYSWLMPKENYLLLGLALRPMYNLLLRQLAMRSGLKCIK